MVKLFLVVLMLSTSFIFLGCQEEIDLEHAVPTVEMYKTSAYHLSPEEVDKATGYGFFTYVEKFIKINKRTNPITLEGKDIEKVPPTNPNIQPFKDAKMFRSCFYNSQGHTLESKKGLFVSQGLLFKNKEAADSLEKGSLLGFENHYVVVLRKGNVVVVVNMWLDNMGPTAELIELVEFAKANRFKATVVDLRKK